MVRRLSDEQRRSLSSEFEKIDLQDRYVAYAIIDKKLSNKDFDVLISPASMEEQNILKQLREHSSSDSEFVEELISPLFEEKKLDLDEPAVKELLHDVVLKRVETERFYEGQFFILSNDVEQAMGDAVEALESGILLHLVDGFKLEKKTNKEFSAFLDEAESEEKHAFDELMATNKGNAKEALRVLKNERIELGDLKFMLEELQSESPRTRAHEAFSERTKRIEKRQQKLGDLRLEVLGTLRAIKHAELPVKVKLDAVAGSVIDWAYRLGVERGAVLHAFTEIQEGIEQGQTPKEMTYNHIRGPLRQAMLRGLMDNVDSLEKSGYEEELDISQRIKQFIDAADRIPEKAIDSEIWELQMEEEDAADNKIIINSLYSKP